ncbi:MAG: GNAT family N-acetyltransferase [Ramlibacter sp.]|nr:GNAT family N-acetyltransferase [Ramlibacter sp.]
MYTFRPITRQDFPLLGHWLTQPHVLRWWADDPSPQALEVDYGGTIDGTEPSEVFIALRAGTPLGLIQRFRLTAYPQYLEALRPLVDVPAGAYSIDYLIGERDSTGRGWGSEMIRVFTQAIWREDAQASAVIVPVHTANAASGRALEKAGFSCVASGLLEPDNPVDDWSHHIYRADAQR